MNIKPLVISQKNSMTKFTFPAKVNIVGSTELSEEIIYLDPSLSDSNYVIDSEDGLQLHDLINIKINIANTGVIYASFKRDEFTIERKEELFSRLVELRDNLTPTKETQGLKLVRIFKIIDYFKPVFVSYVNNGDYIFTRASIDELLKDIEIGYKILVLLPSINLTPIKKERNKIVLFKKPVKKPKDPEEPKAKKEKGKYKLPTLFTFDYMFFLIFAAFIAFAVYVSIFQIINGEAIAAFILVLAVVFVITLNFATYRTYRDGGDFVYEIGKIWVPILYPVLGAIIGTMIGFVVAQFVMTTAEDVVVDFGLLIAIVMPSTVAIAIASIFSPLLTSKITANFAKNHVNHD